MKELGNTRDIGNARDTRDIGNARDNWNIRNNREQPDFFWPLGWGILLAGILLLSSFAPGISRAEQAPGGRDLQEVRLQLKWNHQFQFAGYYAALEKGYYAGAGLDVEIREAVPGQDPMEAVFQGEAEFAVGTSDVLLYDARGEPVVVLGVIFQQSPLVLLSLQGRGISSLPDLTGEAVMIEAHSAELLAYLAGEGIPPGTLDIIPHSFDPMDLVEGKAAAMSAYSTDEPFQLKELGLEYITFSPREAGIDFYGDCFFTIPSLVESDPGLVQQFTQASLEGWQYALDNPREIIDLILEKYSTRKNREHLEFEYEMMVDLIDHPSTRVGDMSPERWEYMADTYKELGMIPTDYQITGLLYDDYIQREQPGGTGAGAPLFLYAAGLVALGLATYLLARQKHVRK